MVVNGEWRWCMNRRQPVHGELLKMAKCQAFSSLFLILPGLILPPAPAQIPPFSPEFGRFRANLARLTPAGKEASMWVERRL